jgi:hypothetical protein
MELARKIVYDTTKGLDVKAMEKARYMGLVGCIGNPRDAVHVFDPTNTTAGLAQEEAILEQDRREMTGITESHFGNVPQQADTATAMSIITQEGNVNLDTLLMFFGETTLMPLLRFYAACAMRWMEPSEVQEILGTRTEPPPLGAVVGQDFKIDLMIGPSAASKAASIRGKQAAIQVLGQMMNAAPQRAAAAIDALMPSYLADLGVPEAAAAYAQSGQQVQGAESPAGQGIPGMPNMANQDAMATQGRGPMPEETPEMAYTRQ